MQVNPISSGCLGDKYIAHSNYLNIVCTIYTFPPVLDRYDSETVDAYQA